MAGAERAATMQVTSTWLTDCWSLSLLSSLVSPVSPALLSIHASSDGAAKFAVKGFTEALIGDFRVHAPHLQAFLCMPGFVGTSIALNSFKLARRLAGKSDTVPAKLVQSDHMSNNRRGIGLTPSQAAAIMRTNEP